MDIQQLKQQITHLIGAVSIEEDERKELLSLLDESTLEQLQELEDNLLRQLAMDTYFLFLEDMEKEDVLLTEDDLPEVSQKIMDKIIEKQSQVLTQVQIEQIRGHIESISSQPTSDTPSPTPPVPPSSVVN